VLVHAGAAAAGDAAVGVEMVDCAVVSSDAIIFFE